MILRNSTFNKTLTTISSVRIFFILHLKTSRQFVFRFEKDFCSWFPNLISLSVNLSLIGPVTQAYIMIYEALTCLADELNDYFKSKHKINEDKVVLSALVNQDGTIAIQGENKIVLTMINMEKETARSMGQKSMSALQGEPPLNLNIYLLFSAYFTGNNYPEALRFLSFILAYFNNKSVFTTSNTPALHSRIEKLTFEIVDLNPDALSNMWSTIGAKYLPSVLYKVRMLTFDQNVIREFRPRISNVSDNDTNKAV